MESYLIGFGAAAALAFVMITSARASVRRREARLFSRRRGAQG